MEAMTSVSTLNKEMAILNLPFLMVSVSAAFPLYMAFLSGG
jgi:hypothetical protein